MNMLLLKKYSAQISLNKNKYIHEGAEFLLFLEKSVSNRKSIQVLAERESFRAPQKSSPVYQGCAKFPTFFFRFPMTFQELATLTEESYKSKMILEGKEIGDRGGRCHPKVLVRLSNESHLVEGRFVMHALEHVTF